MRFDFIDIPSFITAAIAMAAFNLPANAGLLFVDDDNTGVVATGTSMSPYSAIQEAIDSARPGDSIMIAKGRYPEKLRIHGKQLVVLGGFRGATNADYVAGRGGFFDIQRPFEDTVSVEGDTLAPVLLLSDYAATGSVIDGLRLANGRRGIELDTDSTWPHIDSITISRCCIEHNGLPVEDYWYGGGILLNGSHHRVVENRILNNRAGRGGALCSTGDNVLIENNLISENRGYHDHCGGLYLAGHVIVTGNVIENNRVMMDYGWGGGVLVLGTARMSGNTIRGNHAPSYGGAVFVDEGALCTLHNDLIYGNSAGDRGAGVAADNGDPGPSTVHIINCTIANNSSPDPNGGNGLFLDNVSFATITNTIFWGNGDHFFVRSGSQITSCTYTLSQKGISGTGTITADPLFADTSSGNFRLCSQHGRWDDATGAWVADAFSSPAIDAGDPAADCSREPAATAARINLGFDGNTPFASKSRHTGVHGRLAGSSTGAVVEVHCSSVGPGFKVRYALEEDAAVRVELFALSGARVAVMIDRQQSRGFHEHRFTARDFPLRTLTAGTYLCVIWLGRQVFSTKLALPRH